MAIWPMFLICTVKKAVESPSTMVPIGKVAGDTASIGGVSPVPLMVEGTEATPSVLVAIVSVAVVAPEATGVNMNASTQFVPAASVLPAVVPHDDWLGTAMKAAAPGPLKEKLGAAMDVPPVFEIVR
jgi:hypothetical protein